MKYQLREVESTIVEPVDLTTVKSYCRIDADYTSEDSDLNILITAARQRLESYLNIGFTKRDVELQWDGYKMEMPLSPTGDIISVKDGNTTLDESEYTVDSYTAKSIFVNPIASCGLNYFYTLNGEVEISRSNNLSNAVYKCIYSTGYDVLPSGLKMALLAEIDYLFKQRGMPDNSVISDAAMLLSHGWSRNLVL